ncbi:MAG: hypothetical protein RL512_33 [Bacteroidota bacterium]
MAYYPSQMLVKAIPDRTGSISLDPGNKELPQKFGKAKVREFGNWKNFKPIFYPRNDIKNQLGPNTLELGLNTILFTLHLIDQRRERIFKRILKTLAGCFYKKIKMGNMHTNLNYLVLDCMGRVVQYEENANVRYSALKSRELFYLSFYQIDQTGIRGKVYGLNF